MVGWVSTEVEVYNGNWISTAAVELHCNLDVVNSLHLDRGYM